MSASQSDYLFTITMRFPADRALFINAFVDHWELEVGIVWWSSWYSDFTGARRVVVVTGAHGIIPIRVDLC